MKDTEKGDAALRELGYTYAQIAELRKPDFCGRVGFPADELTNNNQNIHRVENRLKALKAAKEQENTESKNEYFRVVKNTEIMRLQLFFDGKPDSATRDLLKKNGFRWSPKNSCWQRQLTNNAEICHEAGVEIFGRGELKMEKAKKYVTTRTVYKAVKKYDHQQFDEFCTRVYMNGYEDGKRAVPGRGY